MVLLAFEVFVEFGLLFAALLVVLFLVVVFASGALLSALTSFDTDPSLVAPAG